MTRRTPSAAIPTAGHDGKAREASWALLIDIPMHLEYPSAHSILASALGTVLKAEVGKCSASLLCRRR